MSSYDIREKARETLKHLSTKYQLFWLPITLSLFFMFIQLRETATVYSGYALAQTAYRGSSLFPQLISFIISLMGLATTYTMVEVVRQKRDEVSYKDSLRTFSGRIFLHYLLLYVVRLLLLLPWIVLCIGPAIILLVYTGLNSGHMNSFYVALSFICWLIGFVMLIIKAYAYSQAELILLDRMEDGKDLDPFDIFKESKELMVGKKFDLFILHLSFIGWYILTGITLGLALIYVLPYITTADAIFYDQLKTPEH
ncbi:DUF975 family protein [Streptococcus entericus]|uniref:DUF975 family protein n=1 Tax=Streptococcus entericus TaxID=155680 RepID=UPI00036DF80C|nr:DUF975 family protein [Streptococcus entericus]